MARNQELARNGGRRWLIWAALAVVVVAVGGAAGWYFFLGGSKYLAAGEPAQPQPAFVEVKPFVVTISSNDGALHYLQLGLNLKVAGKPAVEMVEPVLPELQDAIRLTILGYKVESVQTPDGVNQMRGALLTRINEVLQKSLGAEKVRALAHGHANGALVESIYFSNLVIE